MTGQEYGPNMSDVEQFLNKDLPSLTAGQWDQACTANETIPAPARTRAVAVCHQATINHGRFAERLTAQERAWHAAQKTPAAGRRDASGVATQVIAALVARDLIDQETFNTITYPISTTGINLTMSNNE